MTDQDGEKSWRAEILKGNRKWSSLCKWSSALSGFVEVGSGFWWMWPLVIQWEWSN